MQPATDILAAAPDAVPSLFGATVRLVLALGAILAAFGVWLWWSRRSRGGSRRIELLDRAFVSRGVSVALVRVDDEHLVLGVSQDGVRMLRRVDGTPTPDVEDDDAPRRFVDVLAERISAVRGG